MERFGRFQLIRKIGQGGMAEIFAALDPEGRIKGDAGGEFVIKRLHKELEKNRDVVELFTTEADVASLLNHKSIVNVLESGEADGRYFMAMEYIRGWAREQLAEVLEEKGQALSPDAAVHIVVEVLHVLD